jgi:hypothetical protein
MPGKEEKGYKYEMDMGKEEIYYYPLLNFMHKQPL